MGREQGRRSLAGFIEEGCFEFDLEGLRVSRDINRWCDGEGRTS